MNYRNIDTLLKSAEEEVETFSADVYDIFSNEPVGKIFFREHWCSELQSFVDEIGAVDLPDKDVKKELENLQKMDWK